MEISFQRKAGIPSLDILFVWKMTVGAGPPVAITDHFIPELFFDYFLVKKGQVECIDDAQGGKIELPPQFLKTIHTHPLRFEFSTPLILYGARFSPGFGESFWEEMRANCLLEQDWVRKDVDDLEDFKSRIASHLENHRTKKFPYPMLASDERESDWLVHFSPRHKRRLYKTAFGLSRKEMQNIRNLHSFLRQTCDFGPQNPRIIRHVNPEVFYDQPHLNHMFRRMTGLSPLEYFEVNSILQDNLMSASYNEVSHP